MANRLPAKTTFEPRKSIQPIYTGGSVALSQDGRILATCLGEDVLLTDIRTGEQLTRIEGDGETITTLAITPSASHIVISSRSLSMRVYSLVFSKSGDGTIEAQPTRTVKAHSSPVVVSTIDRTGTLIATGGADGVVKVWDIRGGYVTHTFHGHNGVISALHFFNVPVSAQRLDESSTLRKKKRKQNDVVGEEDETILGYRLASGGEDGSVRIWNLHKRKSAAVLESHVSVVKSLHYCLEHNVLVSGSRDKTVMIWDAQTWKVRTTIPVLEGVESTGFVKDGAVVFTGGETGRLRLWTTNDGQELTLDQEVGAETEAILDIIHYENLKFLLSIHADQTLVYHSLVPLEDLLPDDRIQPLPVVRRISGTHDEIIDMAYVGPNHSMLALATNIEDVRIISLAPTPESPTDDDLGGNYFGADVTQLKGHKDIIICMDVDWSGHWLATGAKDDTARLWRIDCSRNSYSCFASFTGHAESIGAISLPRSTPQIDSAAYKNPLNNPPQFLITGSQDKTIKRWDTSAAHTFTKKASRAAYTRKAHDKDINAIDTNDKSTIFASASQDRTVKIWDVAEGEVLGVLRGHKRGVWTVRFAPSNTPIPSNLSSNNGVSPTKGLILTGSGDKTVKVWSLADYSCLLTLEGHTNSVLKTLWLPINTSGLSRDRQQVQVASAGGDGLVKIWDLATEEATCTLDNHTDRVWALSAKSNHRASPSAPEAAKDEAAEEAEFQVELISGGGDGVLTFWADTTASTAQAAAVASTKLVEANQKLQNLVFAKNYREAILLALQLNQPARLLTLFKDIVEGEDEKEEGSILGKKAVDEVIASLANEQLYKLLLRVRDWNTNARTASVAQKILNCVLRSYPTSRLVELNIGERDRGNGLKDLLDALKVYTERHLRRVEEIVEESYLLEFTLREMDEVVGLDTVRGGIDANGVKVLMGDVTMVDG